MIRRLTKSIAVIYRITKFLKGLIIMKQHELSALLRDMSLSEKIEQLVQLHGGFFGEVDVVTGPAAQFNMTAEQPYRVGSLLSEHGAARLHELQDSMMAKQPHHIPALFMADVIHGYKTAFPVPIALGSSFDPKLVEEIAAAAAEECAAAGVHITFSPMVDLVRDSRWGRCMESTGEDSYLNSLMAEAMVKGFQGDDVKAKGKVAACVKHFAAYGAAVAGRDYNVTELSEHTLYEDYLTAYRAAVKAGVKLVMTAFNTIDRKPCTTNKKLMRDVLRGEMGFDGVLISDYGAIGETVIHGSSKDNRDAAKKAMIAGCDIDMMSDCYLNNLEALVTSGELDESLIDEAVMRVLVLKNELGLFENPYKDGSEEYEREVTFCERFRKLSRRAAEDTTVLLKNEGALPLSEGAKIAVVGALAEDEGMIGTWSIFADKSKTVTLRAALEELYPNAKLCFFAKDSADEDMLAFAKSADAVILALGENQFKTGESLSVADISLPEQQNELLRSIYAVNQNIISVMFGGRPLAMPEVAEKSKAVLMAWLPGTLGCYAVADILFGRVNPSGRLSMSIPYSTGQLPISYAGFMTGRPKPDTEEFCPFVSNYIDVPNHPLYSFGFGLSYCEVDYSAVSLDKAAFSAGEELTASVTVTNKGKMAVKEAVQLYIRDIKGSVVRPVRELKGVQKIALEPGESRVVSFKVNEEMLRFYDADMNFVSEPGAFTLWIGGSSLTKNGADFELV